MRFADARQLFIERTKLPPCYLRHVLYAEFYKMSVETLLRKELNGVEVDNRSRDRQE